MIYTINNNTSHNYSKFISMPNWISYIVMDQGSVKISTNLDPANSLVNSNLNSICNFFFCTKLPLCWQLYPKIAFKCYLTGRKFTFNSKASFALSYQPERKTKYDGKKICSRDSSSRSYTFLTSSSNRVCAICFFARLRSNPLVNLRVASQAFFDHPKKNYGFFKAAKKHSFLERVLPSAKLFSLRSFEVLRRRCGCGRCAATTSAHQLRPLSLSFLPISIKNRLSYPFFSPVLSKKLGVDRKKYARSEASRANKAYRNTPEQMYRKAIKQHSANCVSLFYSKELLCWRSDLSFLNLKQYFANILKVLHICRAASRNNQRILFIGGSKSEACGIIVDSVLVKQLKRRMVPDILSGMHELRGPKKLWTQIFSLKKGRLKSFAFSDAHRSEASSEAHQVFSVPKSDPLTPWPLEENLRFSKGAKADAKAYRQGKNKDHFVAFNEQKANVPMLSQSDSVRSKPQFSSRGTKDHGTNKDIFSHLVNFLNAASGIQNHSSWGLLFNYKKVENSTLSRPSAHALQLGCSKKFKTMVDGLKNEVFSPTTKKVNTNQSGPSGSPKPLELTPNSRTQQRYMVENNHKCVSWGPMFAQATLSTLVSEGNLHKNRGWSVCYNRGRHIRPLNTKKMQGKATQIASRLPAFELTPSMPGFLSNAKVGLQTVFQYLKFINYHKYAPSCLIKYNLKLQYVYTWFEQRRSRMRPKKNFLTHAQQPQGALRRFRKSKIFLATATHPKSDPLTPWPLEENLRFSKGAKADAKAYLQGKYEKSFYRLHVSGPHVSLSKVDQARYPNCFKTEFSFSNKHVPAQVGRGNAITRRGGANGIKIGINKYKKIAIQTSALLNAHFLYCDVFSFNFKAAAISNILFSGAEKIGGEVLKLFDQKSNRMRPLGERTLFCSQSRKSTRACRCTVRKVDKLIPSRKSLQKKKASPFFKLTPRMQYEKSPSKGNTRRLSGSFNDFFLWDKQVKYPQNHYLVLSPRKKPLFFPPTPASALEKIKFFLFAQLNTPLKKQSYLKQQKKVYSLQFRDAKSLCHSDSSNLMWKKTSDRYVAARRSMAAFKKKLGFFLRVKKPSFFGQSRYTATYIGKSFYRGQTSTYALKKTTLVPGNQAQPEKNRRFFSNSDSEVRDSLWHVSNIFLNSNPCLRTPVFFPEEICYSERFYGYKPGRLPVYLKQYARTNIAFYYTKQGEQKQNFKKNIKYRNLRLFRNKNKICFYCNLSREGQQFKFSVASYGNINAINRFQSRFDGGEYASESKKTLFFLPNFELGRKNKVFFEDKNRLEYTPAFTGEIKKKAIKDPKAFFRTRTSNSLKASLFCAVGSRRNKNQNIFGSYYDYEKPFAFTHHYNTHLNLNQSHSKLLVAKNPWNSAALKTCSWGADFGPNIHLGGGQDLVFFIDPEKNIGLVNQAKRLKIPTIGVISSGENKHGRMLLSSCGLDQSVHYPIIGNPVSCFFMHVLLDTLIRTLEKNKSSISEKKHSFF